MDRTAAAEAGTNSLPHTATVIEALKRSGQLEQLRTAALDELEQDEALQTIIEQKVLDSHALAQHQGDKCNRHLTNRLQDELMHKLSDQALSSLWRALSGEGRASRQIDEAARGVLCRLHDDQLAQEAQQAQQAGSQ